MFKNLIMICLIIVSVNAVASNNGTISFYGSIVEPACELNLNNQSKVDVSCYNSQENKMKSTSYNFENSKNIDNKYSLSTKEIAENIKMVEISYF